MTAAPLMPEIELDPHASAADVRAFFERDRLIAAYALADLDPDNVDQSRWWVARRGEDIVAASLNGSTSTSSDPARPGHPPRVTAPRSTPVPAPAPDRPGQGPPAPL